MVSKKDKNAARLKRHIRVRAKISGTSERPRLAVYRSNANIYAQIIDDTVGKTLVAASTLEVKVDGTKTDAAKAVGAAVAKKALENGIEKVVFDRGGNLYHGRIQALAEGAREAGLDF
jgi:large subunit ribosomal protein L18